MEVRYPTGLPDNHVVKLLVMTVVLGVHYVPGSVLKHVTRISISF